MKKIGAGMRFENGEEGICIITSIADISAPQDTEKHIEVLYVDQEGKEGRLIFNEGNLHLLLEGSEKENENEEN
jgi:hypothetical protein